MYCVHRYHTIHYTVVGQIAAIPSIDACRSFFFFFHMQKGKERYYPIPESYIYVLSVHILGTYLYTREIPYAPPFSFLFVCLSCYPLIPSCWDNIKFIIPYKKEGIEGTIIIVSTRLPARLYAHKCLSTTLLCINALMHSCTYRYASSKP